MPLPVDYLKPESAKRLITEPVDLIYPTEVIDYMLQITQGHPALLQMLCRHLVAIANTEVRKNITLANVKQVIEHNIIQPHTYAIEAFWTEFCPQHNCQTAIKQILNNQPIIDKVSKLKLENYGYLTPNGKKLRLPLLEMWLREYIV